MAKIAVCTQMWILGAIASHFICFSFFSILQFFCVVIDFVNQGKHRGGHIMAAVQNIIASTFLTYKCAEFEKSSQAKRFPAHRFVDTTIITPNVVLEVCFLFSICGTLAEGCVICKFEDSSLPLQQRFPRWVVCSPCCLSLI